LSDEIGPKKAAEQLGVAYYTLQEWRKRRTLHAATERISGAEHAYADKTAREIELEREIGELRRANEILKDALGFFARDRKR
jgi:transposase